MPLTVRIQPDAEKATQDSRLTIATIVLAAATTALFAFTAALWWATRKLVIDAKTTAKRQLRAYVFVRGSNIDNLRVGHIPKAVVRVKNTGQTPAYKLTHVGGIAFGGTFAALPKALPPAYLSSGALGPGGEFEIHSPRPAPLDITQVSELANATKRIFVHGEFQYIDAFDIPRFLKYRLMTVWEGDIDNVQLVSCDEGNDAN